MNAAHRPRLRKDRKIHDVLIIGAGFSGLGLGIRLKKKGQHSFIILEKEAAVGGTWRENTYPGAACDVPTHLYSYSFEPWPHWSQFYGRQAQILEYIEHCVQKYDLRPHLRFQHKIHRMYFDEANGIWHTQLTDGQTFLSRVAVGCTGPLNRVKYPDIPGRDQFEGPAFHTAEWDHSIDLTGKKVGIIGTGASAIQVIPEIAKQVKTLSVFQRTPPWVLHRSDWNIKQGMQKLYKALPFTQRFPRSIIYGIQELTAIGFVAFPGIMKIAKKLGLANLNKSIADPELRAKLTPDFTMGCKRTLLSNTYYPALAEPHVNVETDTISAITSNGVQTGNTLHKLDALIYATGFEASENMAPFEIRGTGGQDLRTMWAKGGEAYLGSSVHGFPNFFMIVGPNVGLGHNSMIHMIESQITYLLGALKKMKRKQIQQLEVKKEVQDRFNQRLQKKMQRTVWNQGGCQSWYLNGEGKNTTLWPGFTFGFRNKTRRFKLSRYDIKK